MLFKTGLPISDGVVLSMREVPNQDFMGMTQQRLSKIVHLWRPGNSGGVSSEERIKKKKGHPELELARKA
jgi:hypothetical protein